ncbi:hypothetical protein [Ferruginibacter profundus]
MNKRPLVPAFLQKIDDNLLRNKPTIWATRTHLVLWFAVLFALALSIFCYLAFFDAKQYNSIGGWITFVGLLAFIGFVFWLIFLLRFNVFKRYGNWFAWDGVKAFALYFVCIGAMVAVCFIPSAIETYRANQQFGNDEIVNDINELNTTACKLEYGLLPLDWKKDTCKVVNELPTESTAGVQAENRGDTVVYVDKPVFRVIDTAELRTKLFQTDSVVKVSDSLYVFFECNNYNFIGSYNADAYASKKILRSAAIYRTVIRNYQKPDRAALLNRMEALKIKYAADSRYGYYYDGDDSYNVNDNYETKIRKQYSLSRIGFGIDNAVTKKYAWKYDWSSYLRIFFYITFVLTLLVFIFRHSTTKTFFLSLLTAVILVIFTGFMMVANYSSSETTVLSFIVVYYIIFAAIALSIFGAKVRKAIQGIALNLFLFMTPFIPLVFVALNDAMKDHYSRYQVNGVTVDESYNLPLYLLIAEIVGVVIFLALLEPLFRKLYRKWFAAAED